MERRARYTVNGGKDDEDEDDDDYDYDESMSEWMKREGPQFAQRFAISFSKAAVVYAGVRTFTAFMRNPFRKGAPPLWRGVFSKDCARFAIFLGLYPSVFRLLVALLRRLRKRKDGWNYGLAGGLAGLTMAVEAPQRQRVLALFATARALGAGVTTLVARDVVSPVPHAETLAFCTCCAVLVTCVALYPHLLPAGYYKSVLKWSRDYTDPILTELFRKPGDHFLACHDVGLHEGTCTEHAIHDFVRSLPAFAKLYIPIHLAPVLIFKRHMIKKRPGYVLMSLAKNLAFSTLFLASIVSIAKYVICLLRNHATARRPPPVPLFVPSVAGALCGLSVLLERPGRRKELVLFLIPQLLHAMLVLAQTRSTWRQRASQVPHGFVLLFSLAMGVVLHSYEKEPPSLSILMNGVLKFFVGPRREKGPGTVAERSADKRVRFQV